MEAHRRGVEFVSDVMLETLEEPVDAVITSSAGYPLDLTFYQAIKGITAASHIVKPGGKILLVAACDEGRRRGGVQPHGVGEPLGPRRFMDRIASAPVVVDQWQLEKLGLVTAKLDVLYYVPGLPPEYHASLWGKSYPDGACGDRSADRLAAGRRYDRRDARRSLRARPLRSERGRVGYFPLKRFSASCQFTTFHHAAMYSGRRF